jgi:BirA family biotin operon repressor/biotin-[acetyl-CoA-carboxylase] ligase
MPMKGRSEEKMADAHQLSTSPSPSGLLEIVDATGSTNDDVVALGRASAPHGRAIAARTQTAGRGRRGHVWVSPRGSLYLSVLLRPKTSPSLYMGLSAACALGVLDGLAACGASSHVTLKWPNDVLVGGRKLAGILMEAARGPAGPFAVCGVGVNLVAPKGVRAERDQPLGALAPGCLSDALAGRSAPHFEELAQAVHTGIVTRADHWAAKMSDEDEPLSPILKDYQAHLSYLGRKVAAVSPSGELLCEGVFSCVDGWGRAVLLPADGKRKALSCEQASLRVL